MTGSAVRSIGSRRFGAMLLSVALIGSLFVPTVARAAGPSVTINLAAGQASPTCTSPIKYTVEFTDPVERFASGDVTISGTAGGTKTTIVTGGPKTYNVAVTGMTTSGTVIATIPAGVAVNPADEPNLASTSSDNTVTWLPGGPSVTINQEGGQTDPTEGSPIKFVVGFCHMVTDFALLANKIEVSGTAGGTKTVTSTGGGGGLRASICTASLLPG